MKHKIKKAIFQGLFFVSVLGVTFLVRSFALAASDPVNLIQNPSLEIDADSNGIPDGWFQGQWGTNNAVFSYPVAGIDGTSSAKIDITTRTDGDAKWYFADVPVSAGQPYLFQDKYISDANTLLVARYTSGTGTTTYAELGSLPAASQWQTATAMITPPSGTVSLTVFHLLASVGSLSVDAFSLSLYAPPPPVDPNNLIQNPSLEIDADNNKIPDEWFKGQWGTNNAVFSYPVPGIDGVAAAKINITTWTDGDAKWYFADVPVTPGQQYHFQDSYLSSVASRLVARYTSGTGITTYAELGTIPAASQWQTASSTFIAPLGASSMTVFHILAGVGSLSVDNFSLKIDNTPNPALYNQGFVSLTFDDSWKSQFNKAKPILDNAGVKGTFYFITQEVLGAANLIVNPSLEIDADANKIPDNWSTSRTGTNNARFTYPVAGVGDGRAARVDITSFRNGEAKWMFSNVSVTPSQKYTYHEQYRSTASTRVIAQYRRSNGLTQTIQLATAKPSATWKSIDITFSAPSNASSITIYHSLASAGSLTIDDTKLEAASDYMSPSDVLALQTAGHEIGSHTQTHADLTTISAAQAQAEIVGSKADLLAMGASSVSSFAYPDGFYNQQVEQMVSAAGYTSGRSVDIGYTNKTTDKFALVVQTVEASTTVEQVKTWIDTAAISKTWLILVFHQIDETGAPYGTTSGVIQNIVDYLVSHNVPVRTVAQGISM
jgi:peptidoglycan/xylan/chitin deacetylase (PgdA/CDA1 family)